MATEPLTADELAAKVAQNAVGDKTIVTDGLTSTQHDLSQQRDTVDWYKQQAAATSKTLPLRFSKVTSKGLQ